MINYEEALKKPFTDLGKLVLGIILSLIPIVNWIAQGFILECSGVGKSKPSKKMPEWKDLGDYFVKGFLSYVIMFIYMIPALIVFVIAIGFAVSSLFATYIGIMPEGFMTSMMAGGAGGEQIRQFFSQNWMLALPTLITLAPLIILGLILLLIAVYVSPIAVLNYLKNKNFSKAFDLHLVFKKAFTTNYIIVWIIAGIIMLVLKTVLAFIPWLGFAIAYFVSNIIAYSLYGQVFREK
jgi:small-conductance mechanosensitive channel